MSPSRHLTENRFQFHNPSVTPTSPNENPSARSKSRSARNHPFILRCPHVPDGQQRRNDKKPMQQIGHGRGGKKMEQENTK